MSQFAFTNLVNSPMAEIVSAALGDGTTLFLSTDDVGKAVKLGTANNYLLAVDGDDPEGFIWSVEPNTVNNGVSFGAVKTNKRQEAEVGVFHDGVTNAAITVGAQVVVNDQAAIGVDGKARVRLGVPATFKWRVIRIISGTGITGDSILLERI